MEAIKKDFVKNMLIFFAVLVATFCTTTCGFAGEVPKYDFKNPNPKPGLYRLGEMKYVKGTHITEFLNDSKILVMGGCRGGCTGEHYKSAEILNLKSGKFETLPDPNYYPRKILPTDDGRFLIFGSKNSFYDTACFEIYNPKTKTFTDTKICKEDKWSYNFKASVFKLNDNKFALYMAEYEMPYTYKSKREFLMYIYDASTNVLSETPLRVGDKGYIDYFTMTKSITEYMNEYNALHRALTKEIGYFDYLKISDEEIIIFARSKVDYGINIDSLENGRYKEYASWFPRFINII